MAVISLGAMETLAVSEMKRVIPHPVVQAVQGAIPRITPGLGAPPALKALTPGPRNPVPPEKPQAPPTQSLAMGIQTTIALGATLAIIAQQAIVPSPTLLAVVPVVTRKETSHRGGPDLVPFLVTAQLQPLLTAQLQPLLTAQLQPLLTAQLQPLLTAQLQPLLTAQLQPLLTAQLQPLLTAQLQPLLTAQLQPLAPQV